MVQPNEQLQELWEGLVPPAARAIGDTFGMRVCDSSCITCWRRRSTSVPTERTLPLEAALTDPPVVFHVHFLLPEGVTSECGVVGRDRGRDGGDRARREPEE
jgi:hypothetical protein